MAGRSAVVGMRFRQTANRPNNRCHAAGRPAIRAAAISFFHRSSIFLSTRRAASAALFLAIFLVISPQPCHPENAETPDELLAQVDAAVDEESYTRAIALLEQGKELWPGDFRIPMRAGDLYKRRELYRLALAEFQAAESLSPGDTEILYEIAETHGYLGNNTIAVETLEQILDTAVGENFRIQIISDLSWMYFKTYRMQEGIDLLESTLSEGFDRNLAHTLGTLYSGVYNREKSREWYELSIEDALSYGDDYFASVAYYNLALLEFASYRFDRARAEALNSLDLRSRAGGNMVIGELDMMAWHLSDALESYKTAESLDHTPLTRVDMAVFYQRIGRLDEALRIVQKIIDNPDASWMYHFGVDKVRFGMDISEILADCWAGKAETEKLTPRAGFINRCKSLRSRIVWRAKARYHERTYKKLGKEYAEDLERKGNHLDASWNSYQAAEGYPRIALVRLEKARELETAIMEAAVPWYDLEDGWTSKDPQSLLKAIDAFGADEQNPRERALRGLSGGIGRVTPEAIRDESLSVLYQMNPGGLRQYGLSLPIELTVTGPGRSSLRRKTRILLHRSNHSVHRPGEGGPAAAALTVSSADDGECTWYIAGPDGRTRTTAKSGNTVRRKETASILTELLNGLYLTPVVLTGGGDSRESGAASAGTEP